MARSAPDQNGRVLEQGRNRGSPRPLPGLVLSGRVAPSGTLAERSTTCFASRSASTSGWLGDRTRDLFNSKEPLGVLSGNFFDFLGAEAVQFRDSFGDVAGVGGFVAFAGMRDGGWVRRFGLHEAAVRRDCLGDEAHHCVD